MTDLRRTTIAAAGIKTAGGTFRRIERHVKDLASRMPESFSTTSVLCRGTDPQRVFFDIATLGVRRIELVPVAVSGSSNLSLMDEDMAAYGIFIADYARETGGRRRSAD